MNNQTTLQHGFEDVELVRELEEKCNLSREQHKGVTEDAFELENGRISGGSNESSSAFSSSAGFCSSSEHVSQTSLNEITYSSASSDKSNYSSSPTNNNNNINIESNNSQHVNKGEMKLLNPMCNIPPVRSEVRELVEIIRLRVLESLKNDNDDNEEEEEQIYDELDLVELKKVLPNFTELEKSFAFRLISRYLNFNQLLARVEDNSSVADLEKIFEKEISTTVESVREFLKFRLNYQICRVRADQFVKEFFILSGMFPFGHDKNHTPVMYIRAYVHRKWSPQLDDSFRRYIVWKINDITKSYSEAKMNKTIGLTGIEKDGSFGVCFDCYNVSYACLDMDFLRFLVKVLVNYYPSYCRYSLCVDLPWLFRSVWKLVRTWLPEDARNTVQLITSKQLVEFIDENQIPNSMRINQRKASEKPITNKHYFPKDFDTFKELQDIASELNVGNKELKEFNNHVEKIRQEYLQLGAM